MKIVFGRKCSQLRQECLRLQNPNLVLRFIYVSTSGFQPRFRHTKYYGIQRVKWPLALTPSIPWILESDSFEKRAAWQPSCIQDYRHKKSLPTVNGKHCFILCLLAVLRRELRFLCQQAYR